MCAQAYYLAAPFAVERAPTTALPNAVRRKDVEVAQLAEYPVRGLVFEAGGTLTAMAELVGAACKRLQVRLTSKCPNCCRALKRWRHTGGMFLGLLRQFVDVLPSL